ncbi:MAG TPA: immunoglobulin domain-containing protein, partial [Verrucomicrobiae bacterium]
MKSITFTCGLTVALAATTAWGRPELVSRIPNGGSFSCATCHTAAPARNAFGVAFLNAGEIWGPGLAGEDSDGDGFSNGTELGDPAGTWTPGTQNPGGTITNPGDANSHPTVTAPSITTQPASQTVLAGANVSFTVVATGTAPLSYQWMKNGGNIAGATTATLTLNNVTSTDAGSYTVRVTNSGGNVTSSAAMLTVNPVIVGPAITTQPASQTVLAGANVSFTVVATGTAPLSYQWMKNGGNIAGATTATLTLNAVTATDAGSYTVRVTNAGGNVTSSAAMLTV